MIEYKPSVEQFKNSKMFDSKMKLSHHVNNRFKLFPFIANNNSPIIDDFSQVIGMYLCRIEDRKPEDFTINDLVGRLKNELDIEKENEALFYEMIRQMFFFSDGRIRPLNLQLLSHVPCSQINEASVKKIAEYLVDVLGDKEVLKEILVSANNKMDATNNVLEKFVLSKLEYGQLQATQDLLYYRIINSLKESFENDFAYILESQSRIREYLIPLLGFYFFSYTAQTCMQLDRFMDGDRSQIIPLYFCLDWEKTSQSRQCFKEGWDHLLPSIKKMFAHAVTLEILNQTEEGSIPVDYIELADLVRDNEEADAETAKKIKELTKCYREAITDCPEMNEYKYAESDLGVGETSKSIRYLFNSVRLQFENQRKRPYAAYAEKFEGFAKENFLTRRGRNGFMLTLNEETLIFLTRISIKNEEQMRLKDVFKAFEQRGVFLDDVSKGQVADYYEKLNLIEKKSDSGDAKYVKRIL